MCVVALKKWAKSSLPLLVLLALVLSLRCQDEPLQPAVIRYLRSLGPHSYPPRHIHPPQRQVYERSPQEFGLTNIIPYSTLIAFSRLCYLFRYDPHNCVVLLETSAGWRSVWPDWGPARGAGARLHGSCWLKQSIVKSAMRYARKLCHRVQRSFRNSLERRAFWGGALQLSHPRQQPNITWNNCRKKNNKGSIFKRFSSPSGTQRHLDVL